MVAPQEGAVKESPTLDLGTTEWSNAAAVALRAAADAPIMAVAVIVATVMEVVEALDRAGLGLPALEAMGATTAAVIAQTSTGSIIKFSSLFSDFWMKLQSRRSHLPKYSSFSFREM